MTNTPSSDDEHKQSDLLKRILPIEEIKRAGRQLQDLPTIENHARSLAKAIRTDPYDPAKNPEDRLRDEQFFKDSKNLEDAAKAADHAGIIHRDAERRQATIQSQLTEPKLPAKITVAAIAALTISIAPTLHDQFFSSLDDKLFGWVLAFVCGASIGMFITWSLTDIDPSGQRNTVNWAGLMGAIGIGVFCFLLRLTSGDVLSAVALTVLEISSVAIVECLAGGIRERHRQFTVAHEEQTRAAAEVRTHQSESARRQQFLQELQRRLDGHREYLAIRYFCSQKSKEIEQAALDIARTAYHERQAEEDRLRKGLPMDPQS